MIMRDDKWFAIPKDQAGNVITICEISAAPKSKNNCLTFTFEGHNGCKIILFIA